MSFRGVIISRERSCLPDVVSSAPSLVQFDPGGWILWGSVTETSYVPGPPTIVETSPNSPAGEATSTPTSSASTKKVATGPKTKYTGKKAPAGKTTKKSGGGKPAPTKKSGGGKACPCAPSDLMCQMQKCAK